MRPKRPQVRPAAPCPVQLTLFADNASLVRIRPEINEWRYYRVAVWPDLFGRALLVRHWGGSAPRGIAGSIHTRMPGPRLTPSASSPAPSAAAATRIAPRDQAADPRQAARRAGAEAPHQESHPEDGGRAQGGLRGGHTAPDAAARPPSKATGSGMGLHTADGARK